MVEETAAAVDAGGAGGDGGDGAGGGVDLADYRLKVHKKCAQNIHNMYSCQIYHNIKTIK